MENAHIGDIVRLGRRIPVGDTIGRMASAINMALPDRTIEVRDTTTTTSSADSTGSCGASACEKPVSNSTFTLPIILGVAIPVVGAAILFIILQRRHTRKQREEDANDRHASMDFGLGDVPQPLRAKRAPTNMSEMSYGGEKGGMRPNGMSRRQVSMDLNMSSPYLLPPELQNSRESLHSLSRTIHQQEDPYRPVTQYYPGDGASIRSQKQGSSIYTGSSAPSKLHDTSSNLLANAGQMPRSHPPSAEFTRPLRQNSLPQSNASVSPVDSIPPPYPVEPPQAHLPVLTPAVLTPGSPESQSRGLPTSPRPGQTLNPPAKVAEKPRDIRTSNGNPANFRQSNDYLAAMIMEKEPAPPPEPRQQARRGPPPAINTLPTNPRPARKESMPQAPNMDDQNDYGDGFKVTPPSPGRGEQMRGQRYSMDVPPEQFAQAGLGAPGFDPKRLSMGFRPLPPNVVTESDDPEVRANRIRSFYKEYFDDSKPAPQGQYYEDYDENYLGDAAYFDPETNTFVMPYAEPVTRRAMTPPPMGPPRFPGPPRGRQGSMGAMSTGGMRGPPPGPRAYSSASGRMAKPGPKRPLPPPTPLNSLPTPSKLRDDSFALMSSIEFAPPQTYRDRVAGRSESPLGERRPYSPMVPAFAPVVSAFDELAPIPSPHMLRKSGTFTSLDFAPPKKFRDPDSMSDAGSIRSNRSGISQTQLGAIRNGAYRISRIPKDVVFTKDDLATTLKPQWGMRAE
ncbi:uncharacterized protein LY89DRAFT_696691 [Mollisia scopiformis]|uniref:Uncharacterized protein n=1 Tax=Mollisia scopiformis TaxID=149040 RepID=A0A194XDU5_MOLSC|nr:uncharacterized protein LY89DRAFT_696691 [Mollisia scopiformis]KUJ18348.1 hypothetical protein LY89DRAFT_696691 [Mollisia scopiformis]